jgi:hypothetical protein
LCHGSFLSHETRRRSASAIASGLLILLPYLDRSALIAEMTDDGARRIMAHFYVHRRRN